MTEFEEDTELKKLKEKSKNIRFRYYKQHRSRLDKYKGELLTLHRAGTTCKELQDWLRDHRIKVNYSTVHRWIAKNG